MRVLMISEHASPLSALGGVDSGAQNVYVAKLSQQLAARGIEVDIVTRRDDEESASVVSLAPGIRLYHVPAGPPRRLPKEELLPFMRDFAEHCSPLCEERRYDVIHANFFMSGLVGLTLKEKFGLPLIVTFHALGRVRRIHQGEIDGFPPERLEIEDTLIQEADAVVAACPQDREDLIRLYEADEDKIRIVPCGYDPAELPPITRQGARSYLKIPSVEFVVLVLGRLVPRKGVDTAIEGFAHFKRTGALNASLLVVGGEHDVPDPERWSELARLMTCAERAGVGRSVRFVGRKQRDQLKYYYGASDVFVSTPWYEPFGITPVEAMACALPVIGTRVGGIKSTVLCIRLDAMGDLLMTTPALRAASGGGKRLVTLLTSSSGAVAAAQIPEVADVIVYDSPWMKSGTTPVCTDTDRRVLDLLSARSFDAAVIFTVFSQSALPVALICYLAGIPRRLAFCRENPYNLLTDWMREIEPEQGIRHEVERQLHLVSQVGWITRDDRMSLNVPDSARCVVEELRRRYRLEGRWLVMHPGASAPSRRYPPELFARVATLLVEDGFRIAVTGGADEQEIVERVCDTIREDSVPLIGALSFEELTALIEAAPLVLTNNTGPAHMAAAVGTPVVDLYALTNPQHTPWRVPSVVLSHDVPCRNCFKSVCPEGHHHCLTLIDPERVARACAHLWEKNRGIKEGSRNHAYSGNQCSLS